MPIKPEEINASKLPIAMRGYQRQAVDELLLRIAWDYRQAMRGHENWAKDEKWLKDRVAELEAELAARDEQFASLQEAQRERFRTELHERSGSLMDELTRLRATVKDHEGREELTRTLLATAQRTARELRESTRTECEGLLKAAHRRAADIEADARTSVKHSAAEIERLRRVEHDLKAQLRRTLESVLGSELPERREPAHERP
ncbi:MAG TPA: DivIVA domain-containing protein, partial [Gaiellaceae bacterium]|nr:DivIVA domain-containing protein [Gaiellaceae bacterium]